MNRASHPAAIQAKITQLGGWTLREFAQVDSTNFVAGSLPAWHAVRADTQTAGRGRFQRPWVSDAGGLWLSAVVPAPGRKEDWQLLPLVAGLAVIEALLTFGVAQARLRWPNDIMVGDRKLAGLLVDTFDPRRAVIGLGVNVTNQPAAQDASLRNTATRLADLVNPPPALAELTAAILAHLRRKVEALAAGGFAALQPRLNQLWGGTPRVTVELDAGVRQGTFAGVDEHGRLLLRDEAGNRTALAAHEVRLLREIKFLPT
jgi:BirA family biotin operon repressor/biotin-[acetyl-CoA-carboxylase] ligase